MPSAKNLGGGNAVKLDDAAFGAPFNGPLVHESVRAELAARRQGTHSTKTRGEVRGGGAKPWRQKGTGRARAGSSRSPIWTGGGTTFGPQPRHYTFKVNRKERRAALRSALSVHAERETMAVFDPSGFDTPSAKSAAKLIADWGAKGSVLVILAEAEAQAALSFRNLEQVRGVLPDDGVGIVDLIGAANVLASKAALDALAARATGEVARAPKTLQPEQVDGEVPA
jgi:large subunit ribosomal protein L4